MKYKCNYAMNDPQPCGKVDCCFHCEEHDTCKLSCEEETYEDCEELIQEDDELQIMETALPDTIGKVTDLVIQMKKAEAEIDKIKAEILKAMESNGIKKFENEKVSFTYVAPSKRTTFDKKAFEKAHPEIDLGQFDKVSNVKASVRIAVK